MINKKYIMIIAVAAVASVSGAYAVYENTPTLYVVGGHSQFQDLTFEEQVQKHDLTVMGKITNLGVKVMPEVISYGEDDNGQQYISSRESIPQREVTIQILDVLDDKVGISKSRNVVFYDDVDVAIGKKDGHVAEFSSMYAINYKVGDVGIWTLEYEDNVFKTMGYYGYYPIISGSTTMTNELDKVTNDPAINIEDSKQAAKLLSQSQD